MSLNGLCDSIRMIADEITRRLARSHGVIFYKRLGAAQTRIERTEGVEYRRAPNLADCLISRLMAQNDLLGLRNPRRPFINSSLYNRGFIGRIVEDLAKQNCDIVHIQTFSQFAPIIRSRLPNIKSILHMHCQWLTQHDRAMIERSLSSVDLVLGCVISTPLKMWLHRSANEGKRRRTLAAISLPQIGSRGVGSAASFSARVSPDFEARPHHRQSRRRQDGRQLAFGGSTLLPDRPYAPVARSVTCSGGGFVKTSRISVNGSGNINAPELVGRGW